MSVENKHYYEQICYNSYMTILILHGIDGHAGIHWQQWLNEQLRMHGHKVIMPNLPDANRPSRRVWLDTIKEAIKDIDLSRLIIVAHSLGVPSALDFIESLSGKIAGLISVSGFADDYGAKLNSYFMAEKEIDFGKVNESLQHASVIYGDNDPYVPQSSLKLLADNLGVKPIVIKEGGHLNTDAGYTSFPLLLDVIQEMISV